MQYYSKPPGDAKQIIIIGAGGIVIDAHLPAYKIARFDVVGIYDIDIVKAKQAAAQFAIPKVLESLEQVIASISSDTILDVAIPGSEIEALLRRLPNEVTVLLQKPMGENYTQATSILSIIRQKKMVAGVNCQLRYAPVVNLAREMISRGLIGELEDIEVNVNVYTPWQLWDFLFKASRVEILYHSIHYIDLVRSFLKDPIGIYAKSTKSSKAIGLESVKSAIIMDYGELKRANIITNHCHNFGSTHQQAYIKFEGTKGAIKLRLGALLDYPHGSDDALEYFITDDSDCSEWKQKAVVGNWFPHAFIGSMSQMMTVRKDGIEMDNSVEDYIYTMACVEAAYKSNIDGGVKLSSLTR